jgi:hypothetical protein
MFWLRENANVSVHSLVLQYHRNVRYGSKADIALAKSDVRFTPKADIAERQLDVRFVPKADIHILIRSPRRRGQAATAAR